MRKTFLVLFTGSLLALGQSSTSPRSTGSHGSEGKGDVTGQGSPSTSTQPDSSSTGTTHPKVKKNRKRSSTTTTTPAR